MKVPEKCGLLRLSLSVTEQSPSVAFFVSLPSDVGLYSQFYSLISIKKNLVSQVRVMLVIKGPLIYKGQGRRSVLPFR